MSTADLQARNAGADSTPLGLLKQFIRGQGLDSFAKRFLKSIATGVETDRDIVINRVLSEGNLSFTTYKELMESAGRALDKSCVYDIAVPVYFEADDNRMYGSLHRERNFGKLHRWDVVSTRLEFH